MSRSPDFSDTNATKTDPALLALLLCPLTKTALRYDAMRQELISDKAQLAFPIIQGVPILRWDAARTLD